MIHGTNLTLHHGKQLILNNISFELTKGRITLFIGASGAGKTSLMQCIANLNNHYSGTITYNGVDLKGMSNKERAHAVGFVFQHFNLFSHLTALENCMHPLTTVMGMSKEEAQKKALEKLALVHMEDYATKKPQKLSGGQQQRVAIARALCLETQVLLFDEPTSALDPQSTKSLIAVIKKLSTQGITIGVSSHDMHLVKALTDKIYFLDKGLIKETFDTAHESLADKPYISSFIEHDDVT